MNTFPNNIWVKKEITWKLENTLNRMKTKTLWDATTEVLRGKFKTILEVMKNLRSILGLKPILRTLTAVL